MNKLLRVGLLTAAIIVVGLVKSSAASTNVLQHINFRLTFLEQGPTNHPATNITTVTANRIRVNTKDIIAALGQATSNSFSADATLARLININSSNSTYIIQIRDGTNRLDVTPFFSGTFTTNEVRTLKYNSTTGILSGIRYGILHLVIKNVEPYNLTGNLKVTGLATTTHTDIVNNHKTIGVEEVQSDVAGTGVDTNGNDAVVSGSMSILGRTTVVE